MARPDAPRIRRVVACGTNGQPRTFRLEPANARPAAYRRLAVAILGLDVATLAHELRTTRRHLTLRAA
jgi:hypothetical protein